MYIEMFPYIVYWLTCLLFSIANVMFTLWVDMGWRQKGAKKGVQTKEIKRKQKYWSKNLDQNPKLIKGIWGLNVMFCYLNDVIYYSELVTFFSSLLMRFKSFSNAIVTQIVVAVYRKVDCWKIQYWSKYLNSDDDD